MPIDLKTALGGGGGTEIGEYVFLQDQPQDILTLEGRQFLKSGKLIPSAQQASYPLAFASFTQYALSGVSTSTALANIQAIAYGGGVFVAITYNSTSVSTSTDGAQTWTTRANMPSAQNWVDVTYGNGLFFAFSSSSTVCATSPDGITWSAKTLPSNITVRNVSFINGVFYITGTSTATYYYTTDGNSWNTGTLPASGAWESFWFGNGRYVAIINNGTGAAYSSDGISWNSTSMPFGVNWCDVTYGNGVFVAVNLGTQSPYTFYATSLDGVTWTGRSFPISGTIRNIKFYDGMFVIPVAYSDTSPTGTGAVLYSTDGINWKIGDIAGLDSNTTIYNIATDGTKLVFFRAASAIKQHTVTKNTFIGTPTKIKSDAGDAMYMRIT